MTSSPQTSPQFDVPDSDDSRIPFVTIRQTLEMAANYLEDAGQHLEKYGSLKAWSFSTRNDRIGNETSIKDIDATGHDGTMVAVQNLIQSVWNTDNWPGNRPLQSLLDNEKRQFEKMWGPEGVLYDKQKKHPSWMAESWKNHETVMEMTANVRGACARLLVGTNQDKEN